MEIQIPCYLPDNTTHFQINAYDEQLHHIVEGFA